MTGTMVTVWEGVKTGRLVFNPITRGIESLSYWLWISGCWPVVGVLLVVATLPTFIHPPTLQGAVSAAVLVVR